MTDEAFLKHIPDYRFDITAVEAATELVKNYGVEAVGRIAAVPHDGEVRIMANFSVATMAWKLLHNEDASMTEVVATIVTHGVRKLSTFRYYINWKGDTPHCYIAKEDTDLATLKDSKAALDQNSGTLLSLLALLMSPSAYDVEEVSPKTKARMLRRNKTPKGNPLTSHKIIRVDVSKRAGARSASQTSETTGDGPKRVLHRVRAHLRIRQGRIIRVKSHLRGSAEVGVATRTHVISDKSR